MPVSDRQAAFYEDNIKYLESLLRQCREHCVCTRDTPGFDYGEIHAKLGKPKAGARWWTVEDIVGHADIKDVPSASNIEVTK